MNDVLHILEDRIPWFGRYNGYEQLSRYLPRELDFGVVRPQAGWLPRLRGKLFSLRHGLGPAQQALVDATMRFGRRLGEGIIGHVLYGEHFLSYLQALPARALDRCIVTLHQPRGQWQAAALPALERVRHRIFLFQPPAGAFEPHPDGSMTFIPHGVDTDFFTPGEPDAPPRVLYSGVHLRNLGMLVRVVERLLAQRSDVAVDMLVPVTHRGRDEFRRLSASPRVTWHAGLDEHALLALYRRSTAMLLPMEDSGANTAVVEALASGLPVVTTDVGGIRDYGGGSIYPIVDNNVDAAMLELVHRLIDDASYRAQAALAARTFAVAQLDWRHIVVRHEAAYAALAASAA